MTTNDPGRMVFAYGMPFPQDTTAPVPPVPDWRGVRPEGIVDKTGSELDVVLDLKECAADPVVVKLRLSRGNNSMDIEMPSPLSDDDKAWIAGLWDTIPFEDE